MIELKELRGDLNIYNRLKIMLRIKKLRPMFTPEEARELAESEQVKKDEKLQQAVEFVLKGGES